MMLLLIHFLHKDLFGSKIMVSDIMYSATRGNNSILDICWAARHYLAAAAAAASA